MTERRAHDVDVAPEGLQIGPSAISWDGQSLTVEIDERTMPTGQKVKGTVRVHPDAVTKQIFALDAAGHHRWWPIAPSMRCEVELSDPDLSWSGRGYLDCNDGEIPLEDSFAQWDWSRAALDGGESAVLYDVTRADGERMSLALRFNAAGEVDTFEPAPLVRLPTTLWRIERHTQADDGDAQVTRTLEDTPFYARSELSTRVLGQKVAAVHETLNLRRFDSNWVKVLLPFRMPRAVWSKRPGGVQAQRATPRSGTHGDCTH